MSENYYDTLDVSKDASFEVIKKAYRKIAVKYHPDKKPGNKVAEEMFREVTEAYETLKDPAKRKKYDSQFTWSQPKTNRKVGKRGTDLRININVLQTDLIDCIDRVISIRRKGRCDSCDGTGSADKKTRKCVYCNGTGLEGFSLALGHRKNCNYCKGTGSAPVGQACLKCKGTSLIPEVIQKKITLNPLISDTYLIPNLGNYCFGGGSGDLYVNFNTINNTNYHVKGLNVAKRVDISPAQAVLGGSYKENVFNKEITFKNPPGTPNNHIVIVENGGISYEGKTGIFRAHFYVVTPRIITNEEKDLYQKLLQIEKSPSPKALGF